MDVPLRLAGAIALTYWGSRFMLWIVGLAWKHWERQRRFREMIQAETDHGQLLLWMDEARNVRHPRPKEKRS